ncbi:MAG: hypothetical protein WCE45_04385 [Sedimentisphaerales bacterium]
MIKREYVVLTAVLLLFVPIFQIFANASDSNMMSNRRLNEGDGVTAYACDPYLRDYWKEAK